MSSAQDRARAALYGLAIGDALVEGGGRIEDAARVRD